MLLLCVQEDGFLIPGQNGICTEDKQTNRRFMKTTFQFLLDILSVKTDKCLLWDIVLKVYVEISFKLVTKQNRHNLVSRHCETSRPG